MRRSAILSLVLIALLTSALSLTLLSQTPPQGQAPPKNGGFQLNVDVNLVEVHVSALDKSGNAVEGLTRETFQTLKNNKPQEISLFKHEDIPVSIGMVIDNSGSMKNKKEKVHSAALS